MLKLFTTVRELAESFKQYGFEEGSTKEGLLDSRQNPCLPSVIEELNSLFTPSWQYKVRVTAGCGGCPTHTTPTNHTIQVIRPETDDWYDD
jgi:hypothetical protein